jgi:hypothetical protein
MKCAECGKDLYEASIIEGALLRGRSLWFKTARGTLCSVECLAKSLVRRNEEAKVEGERHDR